MFCSKSQGKKKVQSWPDLKRVFSRMVGRGSGVVVMLGQPGIWVRKAQAVWGPRVPPSGTELDADFWIVWNWPLGKPQPRDNSASANFSLRHLRSIFCLFLEVLGLAGSGILPSCIFVKNSLCKKALILIVPFYEHHFISILYWLWQIFPFCINRRWLRFREIGSNLHAKGFSVRGNSLCSGIDVQPWPCRLVAVLTSLSSSSVKWNNGS